MDIDVNCEDCYQRTPLHCAVARNRPRNVKVCEVTHCFKAEEKFYYNYSFYYKLLVSRGARVNIADSEGRTPLDYARELGQEGSQIVAVLEGRDVRIHWF